MPRQASPQNPQNRTYGGNGRSIGFRELVARLLDTRWSFETKDGKGREGMKAKEWRSRLRERMTVTVVGRVHWHTRRWSPRSRETQRSCFNESANGTRKLGETVAAAPCLCAYRAQRRNHCSPCQLIGDRPPASHRVLRASERIVSTGHVARASNFLRQHTHAPPLHHVSTSVPAPREQLFGDVTWPTSSDKMEEKGFQWISNRGGIIGQSVRFVALDESTSTKDVSGNSNAVVQEILKDGESIRRRWRLIADSRRGVNRTAEGWHGRRQGSYKTPIKRTVTQSFNLIASWTRVRLV